MRSAAPAARKSVMSRRRSYRSPSRAKLTPEIVRKELRAALISYLRNNLGEKVLVES